MQNIPQYISLNSSLNSFLLNHAQIFLILKGTWNSNSAQNNFHALAFFFLTFNIQYFGTVMRFFTS